MQTIFWQTIRNAYRQGYIQVLCLVLMLLFILVGINGVIAHKTKWENFDYARNQVRNAWLNQGPQNPHNSAHYGHYVFQPVTLMHFIDNGVRSFAGSMIQLEAHAQNDAAFSPAADRTELSRFGDLNFAWVVQILIPLFIILLCFNSIYTDRENQNLKLIAIQGISKKAYLSGRIFALYSIVCMLFLSGILIQLVAYSTLGRGNISSSLPDVISWTLLHAIYLFILTALSVLSSAAAKDSRNALLAQLAVWILCMLVMPKLTANAGSALYPLEHKSAFTKALREDREKGIDGHNPEDARAKKFMDSIVAYYKIDTAKVKDVSIALPVNVDGLIMQADEEYANLVYDKHFSRVRETIAKQNSISKYAGFINPFLAIRNLSMSVCQSGFSDHLTLLTEAEQYRRYLIKTLNDKMAYGGSKTGDWDWKVDAAYWSTIKDFNYPIPPLSTRLYTSFTELTALSVWLILIATGISLTARKMKVL
jgi:ABC-2 type transport system permease protein